MAGFRESPGNPWHESRAFGRWPASRPGTTAAAAARMPEEFFDDPTHGPEIPVGRRAGFNERHVPRERAMESRYTCSGCGGLVARETLWCPHCGGCLVGIRCSECHYYGPRDAFATDLCPRCGTRVAARELDRALRLGRIVAGICGRIASTLKRTVGGWFSWPRSIDTRPRLRLVGGHAGSGDSPCEGYSDTASDAHFRRPKARSDAARPPLTQPSVPRLEGIRGTTVAGPAPTIRARRRTCRRKGANSPA